MCCVDHLNPPHDGPRHGYLITADATNGYQLFQSVSHSIIAGKPVEKEFGFELHWTVNPTLTHESGNRFLFVTGDEGQIKVWIKSTGAKIIGIQTATINENN